MLLVAEPESEPILSPLSAEALSAWLGAVGHCGSFHTDIVDIHELSETSDEVMDEWEHAALVERLPWGNVRFLARKRLWDFNRA